MKKITIWLLVILGIVALYGIFTLFFSVLFQTMTVARPTPTVILPPTFTPTATTLIIAANTPPPTDTPVPTSTPVDEATATPPPSPTATAAPTDMPVPAISQVRSATTVNIRSGPDTAYPVTGSLAPGTALTVTGQNESGTWWQVQQADGALGWVADSVVAAAQTAGVPVVAAPPLPNPPTTTPVPPPTKPPVQYEPTGWYGDTNAGLTRFLGNITDANGNPVNGVTVEAQCGTYRIISNPSGPVPAFASNDSVNDPPGFYDITIDRRPVPCKWQLTVVHTEDGQNVLQKLSDTIEVEVTMDKSIIVANWRKNW